MNQQAKPERVPTRSGHPYTEYSVVAVLGFGLAGIFLVFHALTWGPVIFLGSAVTLLGIAFVAAARRRQPRAPESYAGLGAEPLPQLILGILSLVNLVPRLAEGMQQGWDWVRFAAVALYGLGVLLSLTGVLRYLRRRPHMGARTPDNQAGRST